MKILFAIGKLYGGGAERVIVTLANTFADRGYDVSILLISPFDGQKYCLSEKVKIVTLPKHNKRHVGYVIETIRNIRSVIRIGHYDGIISFLLMINVYVLLSTLFMNIPVVVSERSDPGNISDRIEKLFYLCSKVLYIKAKTVIFQTENAKKYYSGIVSQKSRVIANPIRSDLPEWDESRIEKVIVSAGRLEEEKNFRLLIEAFADFQKKNREYKLIIYGEGSLRKELETQIRDLELNEAVSLPGYVMNLEDRIKNASMFVLASNYEGIPNVILEAMAIGLPVIGTDCPVGGG